ncbi:MAG: polyhydroxyalkanoate synthesis regulator DNA-binding domain-containing protein [Myxococcaceae bacterium]
MAVVIKKYGNRRLYDAEASRYVTLAEVAAKVRKGAEVRVVDAKSGADLTQQTLTQVIMEDQNAAQLLPVPLLHQLIRMGDDALADFLGRYVTRALELYLQARAGMGAVGAFNPFAAFAPTDSFASFLGADRAAASPPAPGAVSREVEALRREVDALKKTVRKRRR